MPTATSGSVYNGTPVHIIKSTVLRAAAFKAGYTSTNVDTQTYLNLDNVIAQNGVGLPAYAPWGLSTSNPTPDWDMDPNVVNDVELCGRDQTGLAVAAHGVAGHAVERLVRDRRAGNLHLGNECRASGVN